MRETIYRDDAIDAIFSTCCRWNTDNPNDLKNALMTAFQDLPSAEPEIVRCKDCKWFGEIGCAVQIVDDSDNPKEDDFCSFAERREE